MPEPQWPKDKVLSLLLRAPNPDRPGAASQIAAEPAGLHASRNDPVADLLGHVRNVCAGRRRRLMATAQLAPIAEDFRIDTVPISLIGITLPALTFALSLDRILNGITRPFDHDDALAHPEIEEGGLIAELADHLLDRDDGQRRSRRRSR
jgi:hypothetical protein